MPVMRALWLWLLPELARFPAGEQAQALRKAHDTELDIPELLGMALSLGAVTAATQYALPDRSFASQAAATLLNFIIAIPLMAAAVAPFHIRRLRRGLRRQLEPHDQHE